MKPKLIDPNVLEKIMENNIKKTDNATKLFNFSTNFVIRLINNHIDFILLFLFLIIVLYLRYKYNLSQKIKKPDVIEVNYYRNKNINDDNNTITINDSVKSQNLNNDFLKVVKNEVNKIDYEDLDSIHEYNYDEFKI